MIKVYCFHLVCVGVCVWWVGGGGDGGGGGVDS